MTDRTAALTTETHRLSDGRTLAYAVAGQPDGYPVVAHHGTPGSRLFAALLSAAATAEGVRLVVPDRPGYGRSSSPPDGWTWKHWQDDLTELLDAESVDRAGVMGFSGGGPFALAAAHCAWADRLGLVGPVVPPADIGLVKLSRIPFAVRVLFGLSNVVASVTGPEAIVKQYTERSVSEPVARAVADDFHEAFRRSASAVARENRSFGSDTPGRNGITIPVRAWHGTRDENAPLAPVREFVEESDGTLLTPDSDHLGTLLDRRTEVFEWLSGE